MQRVSYLSLIEKPKPSRNLGGPRHALAASIFGAMTFACFVTGCAPQNWTGASLRPTIDESKRLAAAEQSGTADGLTSLGPRTSPSVGQSPAVISPYAANRVVSPYAATTTSNEKSVAAHASPRSSVSPYAAPSAGGSPASETLPSDHPSRQLSAEQLEKLRALNPTKFAEFQHVLQGDGAGVTPQAQQQAVAIATYMLEAFERNGSAAISSQTISSPAIAKEAGAASGAPAIVPASAVAEIQQPAAPTELATKELIPAAASEVQLQSVPKSATPDGERTVISTAAHEADGSEAIVRQPGKLVAAMDESPRAESNELTAKQDSPTSLAECLAAAIEILESDLAAKKFDEDEAARAEVQLRLMYALANEQKDAVRPITSLDEAQQEYWKHQVQALLTSLDADGKHAASRRSAVTLRSLRQAVDHLADDSPLAVRNMAFCSDVSNFGRFVEFPKSDFRAGQEILVYVEIENFNAEQHGNRYETELLGSYEIRDSQNRRLAHATLPVDKQDSASRRHDYFIAYSVFLPDDIAPGEYTLQLTIDDAKGKKSNAASLGFRIRK